MTDHDTHRLIGQLQGTLDVLSKLVAALDQRHHGTHGVVSQMQGQIETLTRRVDAMAEPVQKSAMADARHQGGDDAVAQASAQRNDMIRTAFTVAVGASALVSSLFAGLAWMLSQGGVPLP